MNKIKIIKKYDNGTIDFEIEGITNKEKGEVHRITINSSFLKVSVFNTNILLNN